MPIFPRSGQIARLRNKLVSVAKKKYPRIAYSAIDHIVGLDVSIPYHRKVLGGVLADIGANEIKQRRPFLPAVVVRKHSKRPGPGFYDEVRRYSPKYRKITSNAALHDAVMADVVACSSW